MALECLGNLMPNDKIPIGILLAFQWHYCRRHFMGIEILSLGIKLPKHYNDIILFPTFISVDDAHHPFFFRSITSLYLLQFVYSMSNECGPSST
jgi:hypothetical protein